MANNTAQTFCRAFPPSAPCFSHGICINAPTGEAVCQCYVGFSNAGDFVAAACNVSPLALTILWALAFVGCLYLLLVVSLGSLVRVVSARRLAAAEQSLAAQQQNSLTQFGLLFWTDPKVRCSALGVVFSLCYSLVALLKLTKPQTPHVAFDFDVTILYAVGAIVWSYFPIDNLWRYLVALGRMSLRATTLVARLRIGNRIVGLTCIQSQ